MKDKSNFDSKDNAEAAGNGLLNRRVFLGGAAGALTLSFTAPLPATPRDALAPGQRVPGAPFTNYGQPSPYERGVVRWIAANDAVPGNGIAWTPLEQLDGALTPNGLHFERHHNGIPDIDPAAHRLRIAGNVARPLEFDVDALLRYPRVSRTCFVECGGNSNAAWRRRPVQTTAGNFHGLVSGSEWTGVPLALLLDEAGVAEDAHWVIAEGADAFSLTMSIPLAKARRDCLLALFQNGERLRPSQGYPVRLLVPGWEGVLNVKWLKGLYLADQPAMARNETAKYTELQPDGRARQFTFTMGPKSLITRPSAQMRLPAPGFYEISGLAWSGYGRVARVEVSADAGASWAEAALAEPILPAALTRFRAPWQWSGGPAVLQSRVTDEHGNVQPSRAALLAERGRHGYYHYNAIVSWAVADDGYVTHTYVDTPIEKTPLEDLFMDEEWD
ncbi:MAG: sulfite dehydrogenase [Gammaproteobacteria bacterium]